MCNNCSWTMLRGGQRSCRKTQLPNTGLTHSATLYCVIHDFYFPTLFLFPFLFSHGHHHTHHLFPLISLPTSLPTSLTILNSILIKPLICRCFCLISTPFSYQNFLISFLHSTCLMKSPNQLSSLNLKIPAVYSCF